MTHSHFIEILVIFTNYIFDVSVWLTEYSVTVGSVTLRFYCTVNLPPRLESGSVNCYASLFINCRAEKKTFGFDNS